jgi:hypothetical protein
MLSIRRILLITIFSSINLLLGQENARIAKITTDDNSKYTNVGNIAITVTNFGVIGNGFVLWPTQPSFQYPRNSGIEHLFVGGLWVGAVPPNGIIHVTTGAVDKSSISSTKPMSGFEFTTGVDSKVVERSTLADSKFYRRDAISHQDFIAEFTDTNTTNPNLNNQLIPEHVPLGINVHMETYAFNYSFADNFVIFNYWIKNVSGGSLDSIYVSMYGDLVVRNTNITAPYGAPFFSQGGLNYIDSLNLAYAYDYQGDAGEADTYGGFKFLGSTPFKNTTTYRSWQFSNGSDPYLPPTTDDSKYLYMANGLLPNQITALLNKASNNMTMITAGPFSHMAAGDSINVVFALLAAKMLVWTAPLGADPKGPDVLSSNRANLYLASEWAQRTYNGEDRNGNGIKDTNEIWTNQDAAGNPVPKRFFLPSPPNAPRTKIVVSDKLVEIYWDRSSEESVDPITNLKDFEGYRIYGSNAGIDLTESQDILSSLVLLGDFDLKGNNIGYNTGFNYIKLPSPVQFLPDTNRYYYKYSVPQLLNGWQYGFAVTSYDSGDATLDLESLESSKIQTLQRVVVGTQPAPDKSRPVGVYPNPYYTRAYWDGTKERERKLYFFNLPAQAEIRIYTLAGDLVDVIQHKGNTYNGSDIQWFQKYSDGTQLMAGGEHAWDLVTKNDQAIATGLYLYTVKNKDSGEMQRGKFLVIK